MSTLVLDTHAWVWWLTRPDRLSRHQRASIERTLKRTDAALLVSVISCWEVALLCQRGRLRFAIPIDVWLEQATAIPGIQIVPLSLPIIITASRLTVLHDPADMLIVATAQHHGARLVTGDARIDEANVVAVLS